MNNTDFLARCYVDTSTDTLTLVHPKTKVTLAKFKLETMGTMDRMDVSGNYDNDNYWIALKPADEAVFTRNGLFSKYKLVVKQFIFELVK